ncbi:plastid transcriptionally active 15 [Tasmannia lanceolata]|uniref:plastid transcriptionally active 15 n=1 Tax=Tasmannia lanceolata TaxID=3420 RepID=UPI00406458CD
MATMAMLNTPPFFIQTLISQTPSTNSSPFSYSPLIRHGYFRKFRTKQPTSLLATSNKTQMGFQPCSSSSNPHMLGIFTLFQSFGLNEKETESLFHKNSALAYTAQESLLNRFVSLQSVGIVGFGIYRLVTKRPEILTAEEIDSLISFIIQNLKGIEPMKLEHLLIANDPRIFSGFSQKVELLIDHGIPAEKLVHFLNRINLKVFCYRELEEIERIIIFLKRYSVDLIIRRPMLLNLDLDNQLIPRSKFLTDLSGDEKATEFIVRKFPPVLSYTVEHLKSQTEFLKSVGMSDEEVFKIVLVYPGLFSISKERKLQPRIEFLKQCGLNSSDMFRFLIKAPLFLSLSFEGNLSKKLGFLVKLGYENRTRELAVAMGATTRTSCQNMQMMIGVFLDHGFSFEDILVMSRKHPQILQYNYKSLEKKMEFLIEGMGREIGELLAFPAYLGYKLDERIKHRYEVKKTSRGKRLSLNKLLSVSTERFMDKKNSTEMVSSLEEVKKD